MGENVFLLKKIVVNKNKCTFVARKVVSLLGNIKREMGENPIQYSLL